MKRSEFHCHSEYSNIGNRDSTNFVSKLIDESIKKGLKGVAITDHANLSAHIKAIKYREKLKEENQNLDFKICLGTEIYLVDREEIEIARSKNEPTKFYHLILVAKNEKGYRAIAELSSKSWMERFFYRGVERIPTYKDFFYNWLKENAKNIIVTTACLGGEFANLINKFIETNDDSYIKNASNFAYSIWKLAEDNFFIEMQPSKFQEQIEFNKIALNLAKKWGVKTLINTDAHYLNASKKWIHSTYLKSQNAERETEQFYSSTYLMDCEELWDYFKEYMDIEDFKVCCKNSIDILKEIEEYDLRQPTQVPHTRLTYQMGRSSVLAEHIYDKDRWEYIYKYGTSEHEIDRILLQQIEIGLEERNLIITEKILDRLNEELESLWEISENLGQRLANYYLLTKELVELIWELSLVGVSRGSAGAFFICYLLQITQINPIDFDLPSWRHISKERPELPDVDIDSEASQRANILEAVKQKYGHDKVLNIATFKTEKLSSAILTMCRGLDISTNIASYLSSLVKDGMSLKQCFEEREHNLDAKILLNELDSYEGLLEGVLEIEGLVCGRSSHASGIYIYNEPYIKYNAMMTTPKGVPTTQYDMADSDWQGGLKIDFLTIESLDRLRKFLDLALEEKLFKNMGSLKANYDEYLYPSKLEMMDMKMWEEFYNNKVLDAFQFDSPQGKQALKKIKPINFQQAMDCNSLMRLTCEGKQPIDLYVEHKEDINRWYEHMKYNGLNQKEIEVLKNHLLKSFGVASTQESAMLLSMDKNISGFSLKYANKLRKAIAKTKAKDTINELHQKWINDGIALGNREIFLRYVWDNHIVPMLGYSFSSPHIRGYTLILMQELNAYMISSLLWKTACLCINSGDFGNMTKGTDYGAVAVAIANMENGLVINPSINKSKIGFKADLENNKIIFGLGAINGISMDLAKEIVANAPYTNLEDFIQRMIATKIIGNTKMYNLIKSGAFDEFGNRFNIMNEFLNYVCPPKTKLTMQNFDKIMEFGILDDDIEGINWYYFKKSVINKSNIDTQINKSRAIYRLNNLYKDFNIEYKELENIIKFNENGEEIVDSNDFEKMYKSKIEKMKEAIELKETLNLFNKCSKQKIANKYCYGTKEKWEMDSVGFYSDKSELDYINFNNYYNLKYFNEFSVIPCWYYTENRYGKKIKKVKTGLIFGIVVDKNKAKNIIVLATQNGTFEVKLSKNLFTYYDKKTDNSDSWFKRGNILILNGYRNGNYFRIKKNVDEAMELITKVETSNGKVFFVCDK